MREIKMVLFSMVVVMSGFFCPPALAADVDVKVFEETARSYSEVTVRDGDWSARVRMDTRLKLWPLAGEPVVNCFHRVTFIGSIQYKNHSIEVPDEVIARIKVDFDAYMFHLRNHQIAGDRLSDESRTLIFHAESHLNLICQSGIDNHKDKWSSNFPGSPYWDRFLFQWTSPSDNEHYYDYAKRVSYLAEPTTKAMFKEILDHPGRYEVWDAYVFPDYRADFSAVQRWHAEQTRADLAANNKEFVDSKRKYEAAESTKKSTAKNDFFAEMDNEIYAKKTERELSDVSSNVFAPIDAMNQKYQRDSRRTQSALSEKRSRIARFEQIGIKNIVIAKQGLEPFREERENYWYGSNRNNFGYKNKLGDVIIKPQFYGAEAFKDGRAKVTKYIRSEKYGSSTSCGGTTYTYERGEIDTSGQWIGSPERYEENIPNICLQRN